MQGRQAGKKGKPVPPRLRKQSCGSETKGGLFDETLEGRQGQRLCSSSHPELWVTLGRALGDLGRVTDSPCDSLTQ